MTTKEKIEFYTCHLEDRSRNMWKVIEVSDLEDIMETYHREQVENLNIDDVSKNEAVCNCENEYWKEDESGDWYCTIHDKQA